MGARREREDDEHDGRPGVYIDLGTLVQSLVVPALVDTGASVSILHIDRVRQYFFLPVSYTHLTLPTICSV